MIARIRPPPLWKPEQQLRLVSYKSNAGKERLLKIGELSRHANEPNSTIRHWTLLGLLDVAQTTPSGYQLYRQGALDRITKIQELKKKRHTLKEIKGSIK